VTYPDEVLERALHRLALSRQTCLPVMSRTDPGRRVGVLGWDAIAAAYQNGLDDEYVREASDVAKHLRWRPQRPQRPAPTESTE
jgi:hypothetical protein